MNPPRICAIGVPLGKSLEDCYTDSSCHQPQAFEIQFYKFTPIENLCS